MKMKKIFEDAKLEVICFEKKDIITSSMEVTDGFDPEVEGEGFTGSQGESDGTAAASFLNDI